MRKPISGLPWVFGAVGALVAVSTVRKGSRADKPYAQYPLVRSQVRKGDALLPPGGSYPADSYSVIETDGEYVTLAPQGGGMVGSAVLEELIAHGWKVVEAKGRTLAGPPPSLWRPMRFELEASDEKFPGWTTGHRWNGWATPAFEKDVAERVLRAMTGWTSEPEMAWRYVPETDTFWMYSQFSLPEDDPWVVRGQVPPPGEGDPEMLAWEDWTGKDITLPDGSVKHVYGIGSHSWCWWDYDDQDDGSRSWCGWDSQ